MQLYRNKSNPNYCRQLKGSVDNHHLPDAIPQAFSLPEGAELPIPFAVSIGEYKDISPTPAEGYQLGAIPTWDEVAGTVTMNVVVIPALTQAEIFAQAQTDLTMTIQQHLDSVAQTRNYDGILSLCTYATDPDPVFAAEGQAGVVLRSGCWRKGYEIMGAVVAGTWRARTPEEIEAGYFPIPTAEELLAEMPLIGWV